LVAQVYEGSPAHRAGILPGDFILTVNGQHIHKTNDLPILVSQAPIGSEVAVEVARRGERKNFNIKVASQSEMNSAIVATDFGAGNIRGLGLAVRDVNPTESHRSGLSLGQGVTVTGIEDSSVAAGVGIQPGDVILQFNDKPVNDSQDFLKQSKEIKSGQLIRLLVKRGQMTSFFAFRA
jgi:serine protease Do